MMDIFWSWVTRRPYGEINLEKIKGEPVNITQLITGKITTKIIFSIKIE